jgi:hypothetical protein
VSLLLCDFIDRSPQVLELRVLFGLRSPIRLCKLGQIPVLPRPPLLQVCDL